MEDYVKLLNFVKYEAFSFDVSSLIDSTRVFEFYYREYERENMVAEKRFCIYENRTMISEFNEEDQKEIHEDGDASLIVSTVRRFFNKKTAAVSS